MQQLENCHHLLQKDRWRERERITNIQHCVHKSDKDNISRGHSLNLQLSCEWLLWKDIVNLYTPGRFHPDLLNTVWLNSCQVLKASGISVKQRKRLYIKCNWANKAQMENVTHMLSGVKVHDSTAGLFTLVSNSTSALCCTMLLVYGSAWLPKYSTPPALTAGMN